MAKKNEIVVKDVVIRTTTINGVDYICITDIARQKNALEPKDVVKNWMRQKNTLEYLGLWERLHNPNFKGVEFDPLLAEAGSNSFTMSPTRWVELTSAIGIITKNGKSGGTYAISDIAFKFANWVSVEFELYLVMEFQRLKAKDQELIGWTAKRELSKINYRIHTDAIKSNLVPEEVTTAQANIIYAEEADVLNVALFGITAKQWRTGALIKDGVSKLIEGSETKAQPIDTWRIERVLKFVGIFLIVYPCLNLIAMIPIMLSLIEDYGDLKEVFITYNLILSGYIAWYLETKVL